MFEGRVEEGILNRMLETLYRCMMPVCQYLITMGRILQHLNIALRSWVRYNKALALKYQLAQSWDCEHRVCSPNRRLVIQSSWWCESEKIDGKFRRRLTGLDNVSMPGLFGAVGKGSNWHQDGA